MKKVLVAAVIGTAMMLGSCGASPCDCVNMGKEMAEKMQAEGADIEAITAEYKDQVESCKKMGEGKSPDDMAEAAANC